MTGRSGGRMDGWAYYVLPVLGTFSRFIFSFNFKIDAGVRGKTFDAGFKTKDAFLERPGRKYCVFDAFSTLSHKAFQKG